MGRTHSVGSAFPALCLPPPPPCSPHFIWHFMFPEPITIGWIHSHSSLLLIVLLSMLAKAFPSSLPGKTLLIPLKAQIRGQLLALSPLICFLPGLLGLQKAELNLSNLCVPIIVLFFISLLEPWSHYTGEWHVKFLPAILVQDPYLCCSLNFQQSLLYLIHWGFKKMFAELKTVAKTASVLLFLKADLNWNKMTILLGFKIM